MFFAFSVLVLLGVVALVLARIAARGAPWYRRAVGFGAVGPHRRRRHRRGRVGRRLRPGLRGLPRAVLRRAARTRSTRRPIASSSCSRSSSGRRPRLALGVVLVIISSALRLVGPEPAGGRVSEPLLSVEAARERVLAAIPDPLPVETHAPDNALGQVLAVAGRRRDRPPAVGQQRDGRVRDPGRRRRRRDRGSRRSGCTVIGEVPAGGVADAGRSRPARPSGSRPGRRSRRRRRGRPGRADDAARRRRDPLGPRGRDATGPLPAACLVHAARRGRERRSAAAARTCARAARSSRRARR